MSFWGIFWAKLVKSEFLKKKELRQFLTLTKLDFMGRTKKDTGLEINAFYVQNYEETDEQDLIY